MRIVHFYMQGDKAAEDYATALAEGMRGQAETELCHSVGALRKLLAQWFPDVVNVHGCWQMTLAVAQSMAARSGARVVLTPHGRLEPWLIRQHYWTEKLPRLLVYQRRAVRQAYAVVAQGRTEANYLAKMGLNNRIETVLNALVTDTISAADMAMQVLSVYRKVLDTDVWELMDDTTTAALRAIIKAGIAGDKRWVDSADSDCCKALEPEERHKLLVFACSEGINNVVAMGIAKLGLDGFSQLYTSVETFDPPRGLDAAATLNPAASTNVDAMLALLRDTQRMARSRRLTFGHVVAMASLLRRADLDEQLLREKMPSKRLLKHTGRLMQVLATLTGLEEGFMPVEPRRERATKRLLTTITKHIRT